MSQKGRGEGTNTPRSVVPIVILGPYSKSVETETLWVQDSVLTSP